MPSDTALPFDQRIRINGLRALGLGVVPLLFLAHPWFAGESLASELMEVAGLFLIIACVLGRFWAILYVGGRKNRGVVVDGPYSMTRNPLYFFSALGALGVGMLFGMITLALAVGAATFGVLWLTARREQAFLEAEFGQAYRDYARRVPMFLPRPALYSSPGRIEISTATLRRNLRDAFVFLMAIPLAELAEFVHGHVDLVPLVLP